MQTHEIAAAFIVGGFIIANKTNATIKNWWQGLLLIIAAVISLDLVK